MCPACITGAALVAGSALSTGGIAALALRVVRGNKSRGEENPNGFTERRHDDGNPERDNTE
jgi:hypothetical protein